MAIVVLLAQADSIKWTDKGMFVLTFAQALVVVIALWIAFRQYRSSVDDAQTKLTLDTFKELTADDVRDAINRTSSHLYYEEDWPGLALALTRADGDDERVRAESDLFTIANLYSKISSLIDRKLIRPDMFVDEYGEYTLFICGALSGVYLVYQQPDYRGLFNVARRCKEHYAAHEGRYVHLRSVEVPVDPTGMSRDLTMPDAPIAAVAPPSIAGVLTVLRPLAVADETQIATWFADTAFVHGWDGVPKTADEVAHRALGRHDGHVIAAYIVQRGAVPVGYVHAWSDQPQSGGVDVVLIVDERQTDAGADAAAALARHLRDDLHWTRIACDLPISDQLSIREFAEAGFVGDSAVLEPPSLVMTFAP